MKILFISHESSRTGAPLVLLYLLKWMKLNKPDVKVDVLSLQSGDLDSEFVNYCDNFYDFQHIVTPKKLNLLKKILIKLRLLEKSNQRKKILFQLRNNNYDVVYANTILSVPFGFDMVSNLTTTKFVVHVHELNTVIKQLLPDFSKYVNLIDKYIVPAKIVRDNLVQNYAVPLTKIKIAPEFTTVNDIKVINKNDSFTVGGSGSVIWRKGYDLFIQVAKRVCSINTNFKFIWVGKVNLHDRIMIDEDLMKLGLSNKVFFVDEVDTPSEHYINFDVFLMTSREDPFPLVCIEVGMLGKPIISFDKANGTNEILIDGGGFIVPYLDIEKMADKVIHYHNNIELMHEHGAYNKLAFSHFTPDKICPIIYSEIFDNNA